MTVELWQCEDKQRDLTKLDSTCKNTEDKDCETVDPPCDSFRNTYTFLKKKTMYFEMINTKLELNPEMNYIRHNKVMLHQIPISRGFTSFQNIVFR